MLARARHAHGQAMRKEREIWERGECTKSEVITVPRTAERRKKKELKGGESEGEKAISNQNFLLFLGK